MNKKEKPKSKRAPSAFDMCPKHSVFYKSCGCKWEKAVKACEKDREGIIKFDDEDDE